MAMTLTDELLYSAVKLNCVKGGQVVGSGTGFFWTAPLPESKEMTMLVTNKHVLSGCDSITAVCHELAGTGDGPSGQLALVEIEVGAGPAWRHPDPMVDLCAIPFGRILNQAIQAGKPLFIKTLKAENLPSGDQWENFDSIEDVVMIGCPRGIYDEFNNIPIVRRGITATPLPKRYSGRDEFMVDMACFPGSSGSPVFIIDKGGHFDRSQNQFMLGQGRFFFVGVLYAGPLITNEGGIVLSRQPRVEVAAMMHLGQVLRSSALTELDAGIHRTWGKPDQEE
jgi:hypothetical protein